MTTKQLQLTGGNFIRIDVLNSHTFRIRISNDDAFNEPSLNRYGILRNDWPEYSCAIREDDESLNFITDHAKLQIALSDGRFSFSRNDGTPLTGSVSTPVAGVAGGFDIGFSLQDGERLYGLGDITRDRIQMRGTVAEVWVKDVASYIPIPWLMSSGGWGLLVNSTWRHFLDIGKEQSDILRLTGNEGELDFYLFVGDDLPELLNHYTCVAGRPAILPQWAYGLTFVCNQQADAREMLEDGLHFRDKELPCNVLGLEPGWMKENYDLTLSKNWHPERFYIPAWAQQCPDAFLMTARRMGFHVSMWMCCDYDLLYEAERRATMSEQKVERQEKRQFHPDAAEQDEHFSSDVLMDKITDPKEPWFNHLTKFVNQGISAFKLDGAFCVCEHPDRLWGAGLDVQMTDKQMHNLYPIIYNQQMAVGYSEHTKGLRPLVYTAGGGTGIQQFSATWSGDTGGGTGPLVSLMNHGLSGHSNTTVDMDIFSAAGIHFGFLQPWSQLCSWAYWRHPWYLGDELEPIFKFYAQLRSRLIPYIYSMAHVAANTGMPILRAMPLTFPDDDASDNLLRQYMLGDAFLVGAFEESFHLSAGKWIDFWTGKRYDGERDFVYQKPTQRGGPLFLREGAIVPLGAAMDYWGQKSLDKIELHVFPAERSQFILTEDDGVTLDYLQGKISTTTFTCTRSATKILFMIENTKSTFNDIPQSRHYSIIVYLDHAPNTVTINDANVSDIKWDDERNALRIEWLQTAEVNTLKLQMILS